LEFPITGCAGAAAFPGDLESPPDRAGPQGA